MSSLSYGGIELAVPTEAAREAVEKYISTADAYEFQYAYGCINNPYNIAFSEMYNLPIKLGQLYWPRGASRWTVGHFLATAPQLEFIRPLAYVDGAHKALPLVMDDDLGFVVTELFMLPPRPLFQDFPKLGTYRDLQGLYLVTLVDERYFWWNTSTALHITPSTSTWEGVYAAIVAALGIADWSHDDINAAYLDPNSQILTTYRYLPLLFDAVAQMVGQVIVRDTAGGVRGQSPQTAKGIADTNNSNMLAQKVRYAGGDFRFINPFDDQCDLDAMVPKSVKVIFPVTFDGSPNNTWFSVEKTLASLSLTGFTEYGGHTGGVD